MEKTPLEIAEQNLWNYIHSLPEEQRAQAIEYQLALEEEAAKAAGGMNEVIEKRLKHHTALLAEVMDEVHEIAAGKAAELLISKHTLPKP